MLLYSYRNKIITYQEKSGNYNFKIFFVKHIGIITYQEKSGNYNRGMF